jgi:hypothetical protein
MKLDAVVRYPPPSGLALAGRGTAGAAVAVGHPIVSTAYQGLRDQVV